MLNTVPTTQNCLIEHHRATNWDSTFVGVYIFLGNVDNLSLFN